MDIERIQSTNNQKMESSAERAIGGEMMKYIIGKFGAQPFTIKQVEEAFITDREAKFIPYQSIAQFQASLQELLESGNLTHNEETDTYMPRASA